MNDYLAAAIASGGVGDSRRFDLPASGGIEARHKLVRRYAYALPNDEAITACVVRSPLVEVGAGLGYWASLIAQAVGDIVAYDNWSWAEQGNGAAHFSVETMGAAEAAAKHPERTLLLIWPPYDDPMAADALRAYAGRCVIFVGESDGCTGDEAFHSILADEWNEVERVAIPQGWGIHDALWGYERRAV